MSKDEKEAHKEGKTLESWLLSVIDKNKPESLAKLVSIARAEGFSQKDTITEISRLEKLGRLRLNPPEQKMRVFKRFLFSSSMLWYWSVIVVSVVAVVSVLVISPSLFPFVYIRWIAGLAILLYIPGFCFVKALFTVKELGNLEILVLSVCISLILVVLVGLLCNFTPLGLSEVPITVILAALSIIFASVAIIQETKMARN